MIPLGYMNSMATIIYLVVTLQLMLHCFMLQYKVMQHCRAVGVSFATQTGLMALTEKKVPT